MKFAMKFEIQKGLRYEICMKLLPKFEISISVIATPRFEHTASKEECVL